MKVGELKSPKCYSGGGDGFVQIVGHPTCIWVKERDVPDLIQQLLDMDPGDYFDPADEEQEFDTTGYRQ